MKTVGALLALLATASLQTAAPASVPLSIPFQGRLSDPAGRPVPDGAYNVRFTIYNAPSGPQTVLSEAHTVQGDTFVLNNAPVVVNSETVKKADNTVTYTRGVAYTVDYANGIVTRASATAIPDGTTVAVSYQWTARQEGQATRTVQARSGVFSTDIPLASTGILGGNDWVQVEVDRGGGTWEALSPWVRLFAAPYAVQVASIDGAQGGTVTGSVSIAGSLNATGQVSGSGASYTLGRFPITTPGIRGTGTVGSGGEAPGVLAVGADAGTGLGLQVRGRAEVTGALTADSVTATNTVTGANVHATGYVTGDEGLQGHHLEIWDGTVNGGLDANYLYGTSVSGDSGTFGAVKVIDTLTANLLQSNYDVQAKGNLQADHDVKATGSVYATNVYTKGYMYGKGALAQEWTVTGTLPTSTGVRAIFFDIPPDLAASVDDFVVDLQEYSDAYTRRIYYLSDWLDWNTTPTNALVVSIKQNLNPSKPVNFRVRVWVARPAP